MNRLLDSAKIVDEKLKTLDSTQIRKLTQDLKMDFSEISYYQELKSVAQLKNLITLEESQTLYHSLLMWDQIDLALQISITQGLGQLAQLRLKGVL